MRLKGGDRLVFIGGTNAVAELRAIPGLRPATDQLFKLSGNGERKLVEVVLSSFSPAVGRTLVQSAFRSRYNAAVLAISRRGQRMHHKPGSVELQRSEEHTSELQSLMRISYAVFCLTKKKNQYEPINSQQPHDEYDNHIN